MDFNQYVPDQYDPVPKKYVSLGPEGDFQVNMNKSTFDSGVKIAAMVGCFMLFFLIIGVILLINSFTPTPGPSPPATQIAPSPSTTNFISISSDSTNLNILSQTESTNCAYLCRNNTACSAYLDNAGLCTLVTGPVDISENTTGDHQLYVKNNQAVNVRNVVFLASGQEAFPKTFWKAPNNLYFQKLERNKVTSINFVPTYIRNASNLTGIYSVSPFSIHDINNLPNVYIHQAGTPLAVPFRVSKLYVLYI